MMLNARQQAIVIGTLLGDGCLEKNGVHFRLKVDHGIQQREYVEWKFQELRSIAASPPKRVDFFDKRTNKTYAHWRFATKTIPALGDYWNLFYKGGRKQIPDNLLELLIAPIALAVWYMDDGYRRADCNALHLNTQAYNVKEQVLLQKCLKRNFGIATRLHRAGKYSKLYISSKEAKLFCNIVKPHLMPIMHRKLI